MSSEKNELKKLNQANNMKTKNNKKFEKAVLELKEALNKYKDSIINCSLNNEEMSELIEKMHKTILTIAKKTIKHYSYIYNLFADYKYNKSKTNEIVQGSVNILSYYLLENKCECGCNKCSQEHNLAYWLQHQEEQDLWKFLLIAIRGAVIKEYTKSFPYSMLFYVLKRYELPDLASGQVVLNKCCCDQLEHYDYWATKCHNCNSPFNPSIMKRVEQYRIIRKQEYYEKKFYKCKDKDCRNVYNYEENSCPIEKCKSHKPQRPSHYFVERDKKICLDENGDKDGRNNKEKYLKTNDDGFEHLLDLINTIQENRPWSLILSIAIYNFKNAESDSVPSLDLDLCKKILENKQIPLDEYGLDEYGIQDLLTFTVKTDKKYKYDVPIKTIRQSLLNYKIELEKQGVNTGINSTDIKLTIKELADLYKRELLSSMGKQNLTANE